jgi:hypothetical protein
VKASTFTKGKVGMTAVSRSFVGLKVKGNSIVNPWCQHPSRVRAPANLSFEAALVALIDLVSLLIN